MVSEQEKRLTRSCMEMALEAGAQKVRVTLSKSSMDLVATLDGEVDKVTACQDRNLEICIFADGRYGAFSTNRLEEAALRRFVGDAVQTTRMLAPDPCRDLPSPERQTKAALTGLELGLYDSAYEGVTAAERRQQALGASVWPASGILRGIRHRQGVRPDQDGSLLRQDQCEDRVFPRRNHPR